MNRKIKCRAISTDIGKWVYGSYYECEGTAVIIHKQGMNLMQHTDVSPGTQGQFTGLLDKNGMEIYEGDIVKTITTDRAMRVSWNKKFASFCLDKNDWAFSHWFGESLDPELCEIIGNIHENSELLKKPNSKTK